MGMKGSDRLMAAAIGVRGFTSSRMFGRIRLVGLLLAAASVVVSACSTDAQPATTLSFILAILSLIQVMSLGPGTHSCINFVCTSH